MSITIVIFVFDTIIIIVIVNVFTIIQNTACPPVTGVTGVVEGEYKSACFGSNRVARTW